MTCYFMTVFTPHKKKSFLTAETTLASSNRATGLNIKFQRVAKRTRMETRSCIHHRFRNCILSSWNGSVQAAATRVVSSGSRKKFRTRSFSLFLVSFSSLFNLRLSVSHSCFWRCSSKTVVTLYVLQIISLRAREFTYLYTSYFGYFSRCSISYIYINCGWKIAKPNVFCRGLC